MHSKKKVASMEALQDITPKKFLSSVIRKNVTPILLFLVSFSVRLIYLFEFYAKSPFTGYLYLDAFRYNSWAQSIAFGVQHAIEPTFRAPLYPIFLAVIYKIFGYDLFTARLAQMLISALACVLIYFIAAKIFNNRIAFISSLFAAFYGPFIYWAGELLIVTLIVFLDLVMLLLLLNALEKPKKLYWLLGGAVLGLSGIARPNMLVIIPWVIILIFWMSKLKETVIIKKLRFVYSLYFLVGVFVVILPVTLSNYVTAKDFVLISSQGGINFYMGNNPDADGKSAQPPARVTTHGEFLDDAYLASVALAEEGAGRQLKPSQVSNYWYARGVEFIIDQPGRWLKLMGRKFAYFWTGDEVTNNEDTYYFIRFSNVLGLLMWHRGLAFPFGIICPLALVGIILSRKLWRKLLLFYGYTFLYMVSVIMFFVCGRYRLPVIPILLIFAGFTVDYGIRKLKSHQYKLFTGCLAMILVFGILVNVDIGGTTDRNRARAHIYGARAYQSFENYELAIKEYQKAIELEPEDIEAMHGMGIAYIDMNEYNLAEQTLKKLLGIVPYFAPAHFDLGSVYVAQGRYPEAENEYETALEIDPNFERAAVWAALVYEKLEQPDEALKKWERVLQINPDNQQAKSKVEEAKKGAE
jgi:4-amino-4-deoxy-L-arabinose transferase-like glycosyltransferase/Tfp pilus assembly protein PilF